MYLSKTILAAAAAALLCLSFGLAASPSADAAGPVERSLGNLQKKRQISKHRARWALRVYTNARLLSKRLDRPVRGRSKRAKERRSKIAPRRRPMRWQVRNIQNLARRGELRADRMAPLFTTLSNNTRWFRNNGPAPAGLDRRFGNSRIIFQYFTGSGWQFHPLSNFSKLNAVWTVDTPPARRAQRSFARELIRWGVRRRGALTWEYYFTFQGSRAPWISSISQGTAMQALSRVAYRMNNRSIMRAARLAGESFAQDHPRGVRLKTDGGNHYLGYSGAPRLIILNMFLQSLNGMRTYSVLEKDRRVRKLYLKGIDAAKVETPKFDTGSWSLYSLKGARSSEHYHRLTIEFLDTLCDNTRIEVFCTTRDRFRSYL